MEFESTFRQYFFLIGGIIFITFHRYIGIKSVLFKEKVTGNTYGNEVKNSSKTAFLILGIFFTFIGGLLFFYKF